jgi:hypothetical protein
MISISLSHKENCAEVTGHEENCAEFTGHKENCAEVTGLCAISYSHGSGDVDVVRDCDAM